MSADERRNGPQSVAEARREVERTRERMSGTLDELEARLLREKQRVRAKADAVLRMRDRVRSRPALAFALALGTGLVVGFLTKRRRPATLAIHLPLTVEEAERLRRRVGGGRVLRPEP